MQSLLLILFGWLLGLLAPAIQNRIRRKYRADELRNAIMVELNELKITMAMFAFLMWDHLAPLTDDQLSWLELAFRNYSGSVVNPGSIATILRLRDFSEEQRQEVFNQLQKPGTGPYPKEYSASFLVATIGEIWVLPLDFQTSVLRIKQQIDTLNQHAEFVQKRHEKTFDSSISQVNRQAVLSDLKDAYGQLGGMAKRIADEISALAT